MCASYQSVSAGSAMVGVPCVFFTNLKSFRRVVCRSFKKKNSKSPASKTSAGWGHHPFPKGKEPTDQLDNFYCQFPNIQQGNKISKKTEARWSFCLSSTEFHLSKKPASSSNTGGTAGSTRGGLNEWLCHKERTAKACWQNCGSRDLHCWKRKCLIPMFVPFFGIPQYQLEGIFRKGNCLMQASG